MTSFREAVEARNATAIGTTLAEDVVFTSPVANTPFPGRALATAILRGAMRVFEDFRYVREIANADGRDHVLVFQARVGDTEVHGCDFLHFDDDGLIDDITVMVRPLDGANALAEAMGAQFEQISSEAMER
ncbi:hypothetical protein F4561_003179 [Lipingzhangella halophila]|uniref:SnoaL-like domain-containing protein n=1 Tax=Lipingzhangella halophila TaxID=1783352 RepID=A0A7W7RI31_9ACTN|nr:nuclear transport factor 2 family protein [Lipingzhangella halophila]MBB4932359.1 hypothetical protein [Lipingzhangella halophila]